MIQLSKMKDKQQFYKDATNVLLMQIDGLGLDSTKKRNAIFYTRVFREMFKMDEVKQYTFVTNENKIWDFGYDSAGFCYAASVSFAIAMGGFQEWQLMCIDGDKYAGHMDHHYLLHKPSGKFFDLTYDQFAFKNIIVPYNLGTPATYSLASHDSPYRFARAAGIFR